MNKVMCRCGEVHNHPNECARPSTVMKNLCYRDWNFDVADDESWLRVRFHVDGKEQKGRKWRLSPHMLKSEVVQTALMAVLYAEEHEAREHFLYRGEAIFGPHYNVDRLLELCHQGGQVERPLDVDQATQPVQSWPSVLVPVREGRDPGTLILGPPPYRDGSTK